ncbi:MAG: lysophospholipid acyltransferase family protein [Burkholderiales bacterium]
MRREFNRWVIRWTRIGRFGLHLLRGAAIAGLLFPLQSAERRKREIELWAAQLCDILRVRIFLHGTPPPYDLRPLMLVANHVSWVDVFAIDAVTPVRFVAKAEVRKWPFVGWLSARTGTLFIDRGRRHDTARVNDVVAEAMRAGEMFAVFPEGTTTDGSTVRKFHSSLLEPALKAGAAIQPVALRYEREDGSLCTEAAYHNPQSAWDTLVAIASQPSVIVHVCFLPPIIPGERNRRAVAFEAWDVIALTLFPEVPGIDTETADDRLAVMH